MKFLEPAVSEEYAWNVLHRRRFGRLRRLAKPLFVLSRRETAAKPDDSHPQREHGRLPYVELVWLPYYLVMFQAEIRGQIRPVSVVVGGHEPTAAVIDLSAAAWTTGTDRESFPPALPQGEIPQIARRALLAVVLRSPGWSRKPELSDPMSIELIQYPLWVYYFARRGGILDVRLLDGVTGQPVGTKVKLAFLQALAGADKTR